MKDNGKNDGIFLKLTNGVKSRASSARELTREFLGLSLEEKRKRISGFILNNAMYIIITLAVITIAVVEPRFLSLASIINIISLTAARLPIALGIGGAIVLTGTDISAGRIVGLTACIAASLLQMTTYVNKIFPGIPTLPIPCPWHRRWSGFQPPVPRWNASDRWQRKCRSHPCPSGSGWYR